MTPASEDPPPSFSAGPAGPGTLLRPAHVDARSTPLLDDITRWAARACQAPVALISLIDEQRHWIESSVGLDVSEADRALEFCSRVIRAGDLLVVPAGPAPRPEPRAASAAAIGFAAGMPLVVGGGRPLGTLSVFDRTPRELHAAQGDDLRTLGRLAVAQLEVRRHAADLAARVEEGERRARLVALAAEVAVAQTQHDAPGLVLQRCAEAIVRYLDTALARIWTLDPETRLLELQASAGILTGRDGAHGRVPVGQRGIGRIAEGRHPYVTDAAPDDPAIEDPEWARREGLVGFAGYPLLADGRAVGVVAVFARTPLSAVVLGALGSAADQVARYIDRHRTETALAERENLLRTIFDTEPECVKLMAADGRLLDMNRAGLAMIECDVREHVIGQSVLSLVVPEHREQFLGLVRDVFRGVPGELEFAIVGLKGTPRRVSMRAVPLRDPRGEVMALLSITRDVTAQRRAEQALRESEERLRQALKMEAVGRLAGGIAHDFNNLLTVISGRSQLLLARLEPGDPARRHVELIERTADRAASLTHQLLAFSRKQLLQPRVLDLNDVVRGLRGMLRRLIGEDIALTTVLAPDVGHVRADPGQIEQVIVNLVVNARDAMPHGGELALEIRETTAGPAFAGRHPDATPGPYVCLTVRDTGVGMDAETQARLFEPFFTTKGPGRGTGLGLATVYGIVKQSEGVIEVESAPARGTTFHIYLPRVAAPAEAVPGSRATAGAPRGVETILVVEDEDAVRDLAREILEGRGYQVLDAAGPREALRIAGDLAAPIGLLLTDVVMPGMSGPALAERLTELRPGLRVLYMSGYTEDAIVHHGVLDPDVVLLAKPFTPDALARKVRELLDAPGS